MIDIFVSYRGNDRSRVREIEQYLKNFGWCHDFLDDIDLGDLRQFRTKHL